MQVQSAVNQSIVYNTRCKALAFILFLKWKHSSFWYTYESSIEKQNNIGLQHSKEKSVIIHSTKQNKTHVNQLKNIIVHIKR